MNVSDEQRKDRIRHGALEPINLLIQHAHGAAAATLILAGIDVMAHVGRRHTRDQAEADDFKIWVADYFNVGREKSHITPDEWWAARCALLHTCRRPIPKT